MQGTVGKERRDLLWGGHVSRLVYICSRRAIRPVNRYRFGSAKTIRRRPVIDPRNHDQLKQSVDIRSVRFPVSSNACPVPSLHRMP